MWQSCWPRCMSSRLKQSELLAFNPSSSVYTILYAWMFPALKVTCRYCMLPCSYLPDAQSTGSRHVLIVPTGSVCRCKHSVVSFVSDGPTWHASGMRFTSASAKSSLLTSYSQLPSSCFFVAIQYAVSTHVQSFPALESRMLV